MGTHLWDRRSVLTGLGAAVASTWVPPSADALGLADDKIKVIRYFTQSRRLPTAGTASRWSTSPPTSCMIETERGLIGIGEGGEPTTMEECASMLIGLDPFRIDHHWQRMMRGYFYPAGREKLHSLGALDLALWDLKAKALDVPVWQLLGRQVAQLRGMLCHRVPEAREAARWRTRRAPASMRASAPIAMPPTIRGEREVDRFKLVRKMHEDCVLLHKGAGDGGWAIDFHTELDPPDAINLATLLEPLHPYFCEDLIRSENVDSYETIRERTRVPIAVGEQFGYKWDINTLIERQLIDYTRVTLPNVGGISEFMKIVALAETHYVGHDPALHGPDLRKRRSCIA